MDFHPVVRPPGAFQQGLSADDIVRVCNRLLGNDISRALVAAAELPVGTYNSTYRLTFAGRPALILRVAPEHGRVASEADLEPPIRNEYAAAPFFAVLGELAPRTIAVDFTRQIINRDLLLQEVLPGRAASECVASWSPLQRRNYYRALGAIVKRVHSVEGDNFGRVVGPKLATCADWIRFEFDEQARRLRRAGIDDSALLRLTEAVDDHRLELDAVSTPRLLHNDLWNLNVLVDEASEQPVITGIVDFDGARWGDPLADLPIHQARIRAGTETDSFWDGYGSFDLDVAAQIRAVFYRARLVVGARLDIHRRKLNTAAIPAVHWDLAPIVDELDLLTAGGRC